MASLGNATHSSATIKSNPINIKEGLFEEKKNTNTCLLGKGLRLLKEHDNSFKFSAFHNDSDHIKLITVAVDTVVISDDDCKLIIKANKGIHKTD